MRKIINILDFGAKGDGKTFDTNAVQKALDSLKDSGGTLYFPNGTYLVGTLYIHDNITIYLDNEAEISGSKNLADYDGNYKGAIEAPSFSKCLIYAENCKNIEFCGKGVINGNGGAFEHGGDRPMLMRLINCKNIRFKDITLKNSGSWCVHMILCSDIKIDSAAIYNHARSNNDGFDFDSCSNVHISNTNISSTDDSICLKSTTPTMCENFVVTNCIISSETAAVKLGTSSFSGFRNICISNCIFHDCDMGTIKLLMVDGGILENINISNIILDKVGSPLFIRIGKRNLKYEQPAEMDFYGTGEKNSDAPGYIKDIMISDIQARVTVPQKDRAPIMITGLKERPAENITLSNIRVVYPGGGTQADSAISVPEDEFKYPEQWFFGVLPAYGIFARHVKGLNLYNVNLTSKEPDARQCYIGEDIKDLDKQNCNF